MESLLSPEGFVCEEVVTDDILLVTGLRVFPGELDDLINCFAEARAVS